MRARDGHEIWAHTNEDRYYAVEPAQDGTGYFVTRYDVNGAFTTIAGAEHPGCADAADFASSDTGTWTGVWTRKVTRTWPASTTTRMRLDARRWSRGLSS